MVTHTLLITREVANEIVQGNRLFDFRPANKKIRKGHILKYVVMENQKRLLHTIEDYSFMVTYVDTPPQLHDGVEVIGFRRIAR